MLQQLSSCPVQSSPPVGMQLESGEKNTLKAPPCPSPRQPRPQQAPCATHTGVPLQAFRSCTRLVMPWIEATAASSQAEVPSWHAVSQEPAARYACPSLLPESSQNEPILKSTVFGMLHEYDVSGISGLLLPISSSQSPSALLGERTGRVLIERFCSGACVYAWHRRKFQG